MEEILEQIRDFADKAHGSQLRKYTKDRYIVHPVRVMQTCKKYDSSLEILAAALLHDVLEDTPVSQSEMLSFLEDIMEKDKASRTLRLVEELTDVYTTESYPEWNRKKRKQNELERIKATSADAQTIKYADIIDNTREITICDPGFAPRYLKECLDILKVADKGNKELHQVSFDLVQSELHSVNKKRLTR